ncbi:NHLP bacteriocin system secretion protein [Nodosilinea sp. LEGE 07088]|uniref:NHLP bacteriocin system secretion protein n=1 Tax=Nodosilinea sp. LEGE 07088 TaxID=2777968 RepID=UPI00187FACFF|nr:NHLP bacteriocin system secretion protein [Nodosilinea sp. LEGE 07088]MBE9138845.1 NHLP bacteriocin system secretion protein [Nodosilinea sp. LEGE 07088]
MNAQKPNIFRKESLERFSSPEQLDQLMQVMKPKSWLPLAALAVLTGSALVWAVYGSIPVTVEGKGVLVYPRRVVQVEAEGQGQLMSLLVSVGDVVEAGQVIAIVDQTELQKQLQQQQDKLAELESQDEAVGSLQGVSVTQELQAIEQQRLFLQQRLQELQALTPQLQINSGESLQQQRASLQERLQNAQQLAPVMAQRVDARKTLLAAGALTRDELLKVEQEHLQNQETIADAQAQLQELTLKATEAERSHRENLSTMTELRAKLRELDSREATLAQQTLEARTAREKEIQETEREISRLEVQLDNSRQVVSQYPGRILELMVSPGQVLQPGSKIANLNIERPSDQLVGVTYFPVEEGKKIQPGMAMQVTPQTVKRQRFGGIIGTVESVSSFPITREGAAAEVGNPEVIDGLTGQQGSLMQVTSELEADANTVSGYKWSSSKGPELALSPGTTTTVRVKLDERAPITFVFPILRSTTGIY